jgi:hypothetical protein
MQQAELRDLAVLAVLADVAGAVDRQVRHQRADEIGLGGGRSGPPEKGGETARPDTVAAARGGVAVHVQRKRRGGVGEHTDGGPHVGHRERGARCDRRGGVGAEQGQLVVRPGQRPRLARRVNVRPEIVTAEI